MVNLVIALECFGICLTFVALILLPTGDGAIRTKGSVDKPFRRDQLLKVFEEALS